KARRNGLALGDFLHLRRSTVVVESYVEQRPNGVATLVRQLQRWPPGEANCYIGFVKNPRSPEILAPWGGWTAYSRFMRSRAGLVAVLGGVLALHCAGQSSSVAEKQGAGGAGGAAGPQHAGQGGSAGSARGGGAGCSECAAGESGVGGTGGGGTSSGGHAGKSP